MSSSPRPPSFAEAETFAVNRCPLCCLPQPFVELSATADGVQRWGCKACPGAFGVELDPETLRPVLLDVIPERTNAGGRTAADHIPAAVGVGSTAPASPIEGDRLAPRPWR